MTDNRFRLRHVFWLDLNKKDESKLAEIVDGLKQNRQFTSTIREGIRLICDLRAGNTGVLLELFPWIEDAICARNGGNNGRLEAQIEQLQQLVMSQHDGPIMKPVAAPSGPKAMSLPTIAAPTFDDDSDLLVMKKATSDGKSAENFLKSAFNLVQ